MLRPNWRKLLKYSGLVLRFSTSAAPKLICNTAGRKSRKSRQAALHGCLPADKLQRIGFAMLQTIRAANVGAGL
jgi:hypothetical protein